MGNLEQQRNDAFIQATKFLQQQGYQGPTYSTGNPLSLLVDEPMYARFDANKRTIEDFQKVLHILDYAKLGFHIINGNNFISIRYASIPTHIEHAALLTVEKIIGPLFQTVNGISIHVHPNSKSVTIYSPSPVNVMTPEQAEELANAILAAKAR